MISEKEDEAAMAAEFQASTDEELGRMREALDAKQAEGDKLRQDFAARTLELESASAAAVAAAESRLATEASLTANLKMRSRIN